MSDSPFNLPSSAGIEFVEPRMNDYSMPAQPTMHDLVMHYFGNVRQIQFLFAGDALNEVTYTVNQDFYYQIPLLTFIRYRLLLVNHREP